MLRILILLVSFGGAVAAEALPGRTSLTSPTTPYSVPEKSYVVLKRGAVEAIIADNRAVDDATLPGHRAGYHGVASLKHTRQQRNLFVPAHSGLNFEHIHDGTVQPREILFEPRNASMELRVVNDYTAELYQAPTPHWKLESCMRYELLEDGIIQLTFECIPRAETFSNNYIGLFWASYIDLPESLDVHFIGRPTAERGSTSAWIRGVTPEHGVLPTHLPQDDDRDFVHAPDFPLTLVFNRSQYRYAEPWYFGVCRGMAFLQMFRREEEVRFSQSPSGAGTGRPAWDFQWFIEKPRVGQAYQLVMRAAYVPVNGPGDAPDVRREVARLARNCQPHLAGPQAPRRTRVDIVNGRWHLNGDITYPGTAAEGLLMNVRMVNAVFEDRNKPDFDAEANTDEFIQEIPDYVRHGVRAFTVCLQGGMPGYEGALNSVFNPDGSLREEYLARVRRVIEACDRAGAAVILGCYYQRQSKVLRDEAAVRGGVVNVARWVETSGFKNVLLEIANEYPHSGFVHKIIRDPEGEAELIRLAKQTAPGLLVAASGYGDGRLSPAVAEASDFLLIHFNDIKTEDIAARIDALKHFAKPIVCNEDDRAFADFPEAAERAVSRGASYGLMLVNLNQHFPFTFKGAADAPDVYAVYKRLTSERVSSKTSETLSPDYFPPPESQGGWRELKNPDEIRRLGGMNPEKLAGLKEWLLASDNRNFAAVVIRNGYIVLEVERGNSAKTDSRRVASVSKAVCATVLAIASERSQQGLMPRRMSFGDPAFEFIPWAKPLSDPRKAKITVRQLLNHTSGICPEATGAPNDGSWEYILGLSGDPRTEKLAFDPGTGCGYSTHALAHAALVCENATGKPYDEFAIEALFRPLGIEHWWFQYAEGGEKIGRHPTHGLGMPARDLARIGYCMMQDGRWGDRQVVPRWFVRETAAPTHDVHTPEMRWKLNPQVFSHGWELPARHNPESGRSPEGIPLDARYKPGSGGQLLAFVPSLQLVIARQTGSSGEWQFEEYLRRACRCVENGNAGSSVGAAKSR